MKKHEYEIRLKDGGYYVLKTDYKMKVKKRLRLAVFGKDTIVNLDSVSVIHKSR